MNTGALTGTIYGNEWQMIYDSDNLSSAATSLTISNLDGNTDKEYRLVSRLVSGAANTNFYVRPNNDAGTGTFGEQWINGSGSTLSAFRQTTGIGFYNHYSSNPSGYLNFSDLNLYAKSGYIRSGITHYADGITGTTIGNAGTVAGCWNNTTDNITSIVIAADQTNGLGVGSRFILMRRSDVSISSIGKTGKLNTYGKIKGCFQKIYENDIASAIQDVTISGLNGDVDILYYCLIRTIAPTASGNVIWLRYNNDGSASTNGDQFILGYYAAPIASRTTTRNGDIICLTTSGGGAGTQSFGEKIIFAKSGFARTSLTKMAGEYVVGDVNYSWTSGAVWNNTTDNITSIVIHAEVANGLGIGTHIELWAYRP